MYMSTESEQQLQPHHYHYWVRLLLILYIHLVIYFNLYKSGKTKTEEPTKNKNEFKLKFMKQWMSCLPFGYQWDFVWKFTLTSSIIIHIHMQQMNNESKKRWKRSELMDNLWPISAIQYQTQATLTLHTFRMKYCLFYRHFIDAVWLFK